MGSRAYYCNECSNIVTTPYKNRGGVVIDPAEGRVLECRHEALIPLDLRRTAFLIGLPGTGKTSYLVNCFRVLNRSAEWWVGYDDIAFLRMVRDEERLQSALIPPTPRESQVIHPYTCLRIEHAPTHTQFAMVAVDESGECFLNLQNCPREWRDQGLGWLLRHSAALIVTLMCGKAEFETDKNLGLLFRTILQGRSKLRRVIVLLMGVDRLNLERGAACLEAEKQFHAAFHIFPGVLKDGKVGMELIALSNVGLGVQDRLDRGEPFHIVEPLLSLVDVYLPWWKRRSWSQPESAPRQHPKRVTAAIPDPGRSPPEPSNPPSASVFISYRREGGSETARLLRNALQSRGWDVFLDVDDLGASYFDDRLLREIESTTNFVIILSPGALDRCHSPGDWLRREISHALAQGKTVVPILKSGFQFPNPADLPEDLRELCRHNAVSYNHEYYNAFIMKLESFLIREAPQL